MRTRTRPARPSGPGVISITASPQTPTRTPIDAHRIQQMGIGSMLISRSWIDTGDGAHALIRHDSLDGMDAETAERLRATHPGQAHGFCLRQYAILRPASRWRAGTWHGHSITGAQAAVWLQECGYPADTDPGINGTRPVWIDELDHLGAPGSASGAPTGWM